MVGHTIKNKTRLLKQSSSMNEKMVLFVVVHVNDFPGAETLTYFSGI